MLACLIAACNIVQSTHSTPSLTQPEQLWLEQNIVSYQIEILVVQSVWHAQTHQITVRNNLVENATASCIPAPTEGGKCQVTTFNADEYTVPGLFAKVRAQTQGQQAAWTTISYDPDYGFPTQISYNDLNVVDEDWTWRVTTFEVLK
jgi:Family of unknown function (DUF6174)